MQKKEKIIALILLSAFIAMAVHGSRVAAQQTIPAPSSTPATDDTGLFGGTQGLTECNLNANDDATSTPNFLTTAAASTTLGSCYTARADKIDLNLNYTGSSTASILQYEIEFSHNNIDWFKEDATLSTTTVQTRHGATGLVRFLSPATTATTTRNIGIDPVASKYMRVKFKTTGDNAALWAKIIMREPNQ